MVVSELSTAYDKCKCFPCERANVKRFWLFNIPFCTKFFHNVLFIKVSRSEDKY